MLNINKPIIINNKKQLCAAFGLIKWVKLNGQKGNKNAAIFVKNLRNAIKNYYNK